jgi:hypothetical protein
LNYENKITFTLLIAALVIFIISYNKSQQKTEAAKADITAEELDRTILPIHEPDYPVSTVLERRKRKTMRMFLINNLNCENFHI